MPLIRSHLPPAFKIATVPILAWIIVLGSWLRSAPDDVTRTALQMERGAALIVAIFGTAYLPFAWWVLKRLKVSECEVNRPLGSPCHSSRLK